MKRTVLALAVSVMLFSGCAHRTAIPDPRIPHRVASESTVTIWVRNPDGTFTKAKVKVAAGWWLASPYIVETPEDDTKL